MDDRINSEFVYFHGSTSLGDVCVVCVCAVYHLRPERVYTFNGKRGRREHLVNGHESSIGLFGTGSAETEYTPQQHY